MQSLGSKQVLNCHLRITHGLLPGHTPKLNSEALILFETELLFI